MPRGANGKNLTELDVKGLSTHSCTYMLSLIDYLYVESTFIIKTHERNLFVATKLRRFNGHKARS